MVINLSPFFSRGGRALFFFVLLYSVGLRMWNVFARFSLCVFYYVFVCSCVCVYLFVCAKMYKALTQTYNICGEEAFIIVSVSVSVQRGSLILAAKGNISHVFRIQTHDSSYVPAFIVISTLCSSMPSTAKLLCSGMCTNTIYSLTRIWSVCSVWVCVCVVCIQPFLIRHIYLWVRCASSQRRKKRKKNRPKNHVPKPT